MFWDPFRKQIEQFRTKYVHIAVFGGNAEDQKGQASGTPMTGRGDAISEVPA